MQSAAALDGLDRRSACSCNTGEAASCQTSRYAKVAQAVLSCLVWVESAWATPAKPVDAVANVLDGHQGAAMIGH